MPAWIKRLILPRVLVLLIVAVAVIAGFAVSFPRLIRTDSRVCVIAVDPSGKIVATGDQIGACSLSNLTRCNVPGRLSIRSSPDMTWLRGLSFLAAPYTAAASGRLTGPVGWLQVSRDGHEIMASNDNTGRADTVGLYSIARKQWIAEFVPDPRQSPSLYKPIGFSSDGRFAYCLRMTYAQENLRKPAAGRAGFVVRSSTVLSLDTRNGLIRSESGPVLKPDEWPGAVIILRDNRTVVVAISAGSPVTSDDSGRMVVYDLKLSRRTRVISLPVRPQSLLLSSTGAKVYTVFASGLVRVWSTRSWSAHSVLKSGEGPTGLCTLAHDDRTLAGEMSTGGIGLWDTNTGARRRVFFGATGPNYPLTFTADDSQLLAGGGDNYVRVWQVKL